MEIKNYINGMIGGNILDAKGDKYNNWGKNEYLGPPGYLLNYYPPIDWIGIGLNALNLYDNGDNSWLSDKNINGEWYIAYLPISNFHILKCILIERPRAGSAQLYKCAKNKNPLSYNLSCECWVGVCLCQDIKVTERYCCEFKFNGIYLKCILMCRVNPYKIRICDTNPTFWIVSGGIHCDEIRAYRILIKYCTKNYN